MMTVWEIFYDLGGQNHNDIPIGHGNIFSMEYPSWTLKELFPEHFGNDCLSNYVIRMLGIIPNVFRFTVHLLD